MLSGWGVVVEKQSTLVAISLIKGTQNAKDPLMMQKNILGAESAGEVN